MMSSVRVYLHSFKVRSSWSLTISCLSIILFVHAVLALNELDVDDSTSVLFRSSSKKVQLSPKNSETNVKKNKFHLKCFVFVSIKMKTGFNYTLENAVIL